LPSSFKTGPIGCDMRIEYNPRKFLLLIPLAMLREYFERQDVVDDLAWNNLTDQGRESLYAAWQSLPQRSRDAISIDFQNVAGLATKRGIQTIIEESKFHGLDLLPELVELPSHSEKAFHVLLRHPRVFRVASQFNYADNLARYWHRRHDLPKKPPNLRLEARAALKNAVSDHYVENQGRGQYSDLDVYLRYDTVHYFMVYLSDYPDTFVGYSDEGTLDRRPQTPAFDVVLRYDESCGHLDLYAEGPKQLRRDLEGIFGRTALSEELSPDPPPGVAFQLDRLKDPKFEFVTEPSDGIFNVQLRAIQFSLPQKETGRITFELLPYAGSGNVHELIARALNQVSWQLDDLRVDQVKIKVTFLQGTSRPKTVTFNISPNSCNLKEHVTEHATIKRYLRRWEIERE